MKLYITGYSSYRSDIDKIEIKKSLKLDYKYDTRRQDSFIHLAVYGAQKLKERTDIKNNDELYLTSGVGNIEVVQKTNTDIYKNNQPLRLFDFINLLGNTTSYYVAKALGTKGKNIFQISDNFTYINTLISAYASINNSKKDVILCIIDLVSSPTQSIKRVMGIDEECEVVSSVNYQKLSLHPDNALAEIEFEQKEYLDYEIKKILFECDNVFLSHRCTGITGYKKESKCFEGAVSWHINNSIKNCKDLVFVDCFENRYKLIKIKSLT